VEPVVTRGYRTARCPTGCETWLQPADVPGHLELGVCPGRPWVEELRGTVLAFGATATLLAKALPAPLLRADPYNGAIVSYLYGKPTVTLASPIPDIAPLRWLQVALAVVARCSPDALVDTLDPESFAVLDAELGQPDLLVECPLCGDTVERRGLRRHKSSSFGCRWTYAAAQVRVAWAGGRRDPFSMPTGTPLSWTDLQAAARWRDRIQTVRFPDWTAVLLWP
jgi:hypothetical protein